VNTAFHLTNGKGYYEQYKNDEAFDDYLLDDVIIGSDTLTQTDLIRQKWLDNTFYGFTWAMNYDNQKTLKASLGGSWNTYSGDHFGRVIWAEYASDGSIDHEWYNNTGEKSDLNVYAKANYLLNPRMNLYGDIQYRSIDYEIEGKHDDLRDLTQKHNFSFLNPKAGIYYELNESNKAYFSFGVAQREPARTSFRDANPGEVPAHEVLLDYELGYIFKTSVFMTEANLFYMDYQDQLVMNGEINSVGDAIMVNVPESYRAGIELSWGVKPVSMLDWKGNLTFSQNKIQNFVGFVDDWDNGGQVSKELGETDISFSPLSAKKNLKFMLFSNYVGEQFIDNTSNDNRKLEAYFINDILIRYSIKTKDIKEIGLSLKINNIFGEEYENNAWVYRYYYLGKYWNMDGYFPQAGINFLVGVSLKL